MLTTPPTPPTTAPCSAECSSQTWRESLTPVVQRDDRPSDTHQALANVLILYTKYSQSKRDKVNQVRKIHKNNRALSTAEL